MYFQIKGKVFPFNIQVFIGEKKKKVLKLAKDNVSENDYKYLKKTSFQLGSVFFLEDGTLLLYTENMPDTPYNKGVLAHEILRYSMQHVIF